MFKRLIFSSLSVTVSNVIVRFSVLILSIVAAHTLDVGGLAQFTNLMILYQIVSGLSLAGLSGVLVKTIAETDTVSERIEYAKASLFIITCLSFLFSIVYLVIVAVIYDTLTFDAVIFSISIIFGALYFGLVSTAQGFLDFKSHLFSSIIYTISCLFCVSMFYFLGFDRISLVVLLANIFSFYYLIKTNKKKWSCSFREQFKFDFLKVKYILIPSVPMFFSSLLVMPVMYIGNFVLTHYATSEEVAVYNLAFQWRNIIALVPAAIIQAFLPYMMKSFKEKTFSKHMLILYAGAMFLIVLSSLFLVNNIHHIYGNTVIGYEGVFNLMILTSLIASFSGLFGQYFLVNNSYLLCLVMNVVWAISYMAILYRSEMVNVNAEYVTYSLLQAYCVLIVFQVVMVVFRKVCK